MRREQRASLQVNRDIDRNRGQIDTHLVGNVLQIVAEAAADRETEELSCTMHSVALACPLLAPSGHRACAPRMSAFGGKADIKIWGLHVRSLPKASIGTPTGETSAQRL